MAGISADCTIYVESPVTWTKCRNIDYFSAAFTLDSIHESLTTSQFLASIVYRILNHSSFSCLKKLLTIGKFMSNALAASPKVAISNNISTQIARDTSISTVTC